MSNVPEVKYCPCGFTPYLTSWNFGYEFCPQCKVRLLPDGTTGPTYAELEARVAEWERRMAWYLESQDKCSFCVYLDIAGNVQPCASCYEMRLGNQNNFVLAPVPVNFNVECSEILRCAQNDNDEGGEK